VNNGLTAEGPDLGSSQFPVVRVPKILLVTGEGVNVADAGEIWHLFDTRYQYPMTLCEIGRISGLNLSKYNVMILADGNYGGLPSEKIRQFVQEGGTLVATGKALNWLKNSGLAPVEWRQSSAPKPERRAYSGMEEDKGALAMAGAIFEANLDLTHPLCFGYNKSRIPVFLGDTLFLNPGKNPYATPLQLTDKPLLAGYVHNQVLPMAPGAAAAVVYGVGKGKIIGFPGNPNFRAFWYGTNRLFANAVFFGNLINGDSVEKK
jgi:hypothetical protein